MTKRLFPEQRAKGNDKKRLDNKQVLRAPLAPESIPLADGFLFTFLLKYLHGPPRRRSNEYLQRATDCRCLETSSTPDASRKKNNQSAIINDVKNFRDGFAKESSTDKYNFVTSSIQERKKNIFQVLTSWLD